MKKKLSSILDYIIQYHGIEELRDWIPISTLHKIDVTYLKLTPLKSKDQTANTIMNYLGLTYRNHWNRPLTYQDHKNRPQKIDFKINSDLEQNSFQLDDFKSAIMLNIYCYNKKPCYGKKSESIIYFKNKKYSDGIQKYSDGIQNSPANSVLLENSEEVLVLPLNTILKDLQKQQPDQIFKKRFIPLAQLNLSGENKHLKAQATHQ